MKWGKWEIEIFPKSKKVNTTEALGYAVLLGSFGVHQFYLGNRKKGYYFLLTSGMSNLLLLYCAFLPVSWWPTQSWQFLFKAIGLGYVLMLPVLLWDIFTIGTQVKNKGGDTGSL